MLTIRDVAEYCNVSTATVSKAFSQDSDISYETVQRVRAAARYLGYFPNGAARALKTRHANNLGLLTQLQKKKGISTEFVTRVTNSFQIGAEQSGYDVTFVSRSLSGKPISYEEHCRYRNFEGVAVICADFFSPQVLALLEREIPCVTVDYVSPRHASVMTNNEDAYRELVDYVYANGHRRIAVIRDNTTIVADLRYDCLRRACAERGLELPENRTFTACFNDLQSAAIATEAMLELPERPTCVFYPDDIACVGGIDALRRHGLSVPRDISVVGFDGIQLSQAIAPRLTTYRQDMETIGFTVMETLLEEIAHPDAQEHPRRYVPGELLPGETVKRL